MGQPAPGPPPGLDVELHHHGWTAVLRGPTERRSDLGVRAVLAVAVTVMLLGGGCLGATALGPHGFWVGVAPAFTVLLFQRPVVETLRGPAEAPTLRITLRPDALEVGGRTVDPDDVGMLLAGGVLRLSGAVERRFALEDPAHGRWVIAAIAARSHAPPDHPPPAELAVLLERGPRR